MKINKFIWVLIICLVISNVATLFILWRGDHKGPPPPISEKLELTGDHKIKADKISKVHHQQKRKLMDRSGQLRKAYYLQVFEKNNKADSLFLLLTQNDQKINKMTFDFFKEIHALCNASQKEELKKGIQKFPHKRKKHN